MYKPSEINKFNPVDNHKHWPASINNKMLVSFSYHYGTYCKKMQEYTRLISSLLNMFSMFEIRLSFGDKYLDALSINCINCKIETCLDSVTSFIWVYDKIVAKFVLNAMLHHVVMSWIISSNRKMDYEMNDINHLDRLNKGPWYNRNICSKSHRSRFEDFITQARTDRYNLMCYLVAYDRLKLDYKDYESSIVYMVIPNDSTIKT